MYMVTITSTHTHTHTHSGHTNTGSQTNRTLSFVEKMVTFTAIKTDCVKFNIFF